jgi:threonine dehydrogenase-like Zn-dependent dehydrogenase
MCALLICLGAGIQPIITSSSDTKLETIKALSPAVQGINYKTCPDIRAEVKRITNGRGVDFVVNNTGPASVLDDIGFLCPRGGTVSMVGFLAGFNAEWDPTATIMALMVKFAKVQ